MEKKINEDIQRFKLIRNLLENSQDKWMHIDQFQKGFEKFDSNYRKLEELADLAERDMSKISDKLNNQREKLMEQLIPVSNLLELYADDHGKNKLRKVLNKIDAKKDRLSGSKLLKDSGFVIGSAVKFLRREARTDQKAKDLQSYGLTPGMVDALKKELNKYEDIRNKFKSEKLHGKDAQKEVKNIIKENSKIVSNRFDKFMSIFMNTDPEFYRSYTEAKKGIRSTKGGKGKKQDKESKRLSGAAGLIESETLDTEKAAGKRKRGRPGKNKAKSIEREATTVSAESVEKVSSPEKKSTRKRKPGRPKGSKNKTKRSVPVVTDSETGISEEKAPGKRKPGRPKGNKTKRSRTTAASGGKDEKAITGGKKSTAKRRPGRPGKSITSAASKTDNKIPTATKKPPKGRKPGRPKKSETAPGKITDQSSQPDQTTEKNSAINQNSDTASKEIPVNNLPGENNAEK